MTRVFVLPEHNHGGDYHATAFVRLLQPLRHPSLDRFLDVSDGLRLPDGSFDVVILERHWRPDVTLSHAEQMVRRIKQRTSRFLYSIDDNLLDYHADEPWETFPRPEQRAAMRYFICHADGVIVSTPALGQRLKPLNDRIAVVPNALDERLFPQVPGRLNAVDSGDIVTFGYMGTGTHSGDLMMILEPLRAAMRAYSGRVKLQIVGVTLDPRVRKAFDGLPVEWLLAAGADSYPKFIRWAADRMRWDFGLAPLADTVLNRSKSDIKFLDYGMLGIPGIFSRGHAYSSTVEQLRTGILCSPDPQEWYDALELMITNPAQRSQMALAAHDYVRKSRTLETRSHDWLDAIESLRN